MKRNTRGPDADPGPEDRDIVEDAGEGGTRGELKFNRNTDLGGNEGALPTDADYSRGSGYMGSELIGEDNPGRRGIPGTRTGSDPYEGKPGLHPQDMANRGFDPSREQRRTIETVQRSQSPPAAAQSDPDGDRVTQGRDIPARMQATAAQRFGRDISASGLGQEDLEGGALRIGAMGREHREWIAVLGRLGGSSPGSEENLKLAETFHMIQFPVGREAVLRRLEGGAEFKLRQDISVDLHHAVAACGKDQFRNMNDLIDCVKDELRRMEVEEQHRR